MSAPTPARIRKLRRQRWEMTVSKARHLLQRPVFGDQRCIEARNLYVLADRVSRARADFGDPEELPNLDGMTAAQLQHELAVWKAADWEEQEGEPAS